MHTESIQDAMTFEKTLTPAKPRAPEERWTTRVDGWQIEVTLSNGYINGGISARHPERGHFFFYPPSSAPLPQLDDCPAVIDRVLTALADQRVDLRTEYDRANAAAREREG